MEMKRAMELFFAYCRSKQLRPKTIRSYEQTLRLFEIWLKKAGVDAVEQIRETAVRAYLLDLQKRGKYTVSSNGGKINYPDRRKDYQTMISNTTINNYLRNIHGFFQWLEEMEIIEKKPMRCIKLLKQQRKPKSF